MSMLQSSLIVDLKGLLGSVAERFKRPGDADFILHLNAAAQAMQRKRPLTKSAFLLLVADQENYLAPSDLVLPKASTWGRNGRLNKKPWQKGYCKSQPRMSVAEGVSGQEIILSPPPTAEDIHCLGTSFYFYYFAKHIISDVANETTIKESDRDLLLIRATASALMSMAAQQVMTPVTLGNSGISMPKNGTAAALAESLLTMFNEAP